MLEADLTKRSPMGWLVLAAVGSMVVWVPGCGDDLQDLGGDGGLNKPETGTGTDTGTAVDSGIGADTGNDTGTITCTGLTTLCSGTCVDTKSDNNNCGTCGTKCAAGSLCTVVAGVASCALQCTAPTKNCGGTCTDTATSKANCGACGTACAGAQQCCASGCVDFTTSNTNCGACGTTCGTTEACGASACATRLLGTGADGAYAPVADDVINTENVGGATGASGQKNVVVTSTTGFTAGDLVIVHQSRGTGAGNYEYAQVVTVTPATNTLTMLRNIGKTYASDANNRAQVVRVKQYTTVAIPTGVTVRAPAWDGNSGGILAMKATGAVTIVGNVDMSGRGYRGFSHAATCAGGVRYACVAADDANGSSGESYVGPSLPGNVANGSGGGGGQDGQDCGAGGGGAYGTAGTAGPDASVGGACRAGAQLGGEAGTAIGDANLTTSIFFGGAGGEGGADEDGAYPGGGGNGGGIVIIDGASITVTGGVLANGLTGLDGVQTSPGCGGGGCGMGGGGGGAGGGIHLRATGTADVGAGLVTANGGLGGACTCGGSSNGAPAGVGRVGIGAVTVTGASLPVHDAH
jgi:hypothetical protein